MARGSDGRRSRRQARRNDQNPLRRRLGRPCEPTRRPFPTRPAPKPRGPRSIGGRLPSAKARTCPYRLRNPWSPHRVKVGEPRTIKSLVHVAETQHGRIASLEAESNRDRETPLARSAASASSVGSRWPFPCRSSRTSCSGRVQCVTTGLERAAELAGSASRRVRSPRRRERARAPLRPSRARPLARRGRAERSATRDAAKALASRSIGRPSASALTLLQARIGVVGGRGQILRLLRRRQPGGDARAGGSARTT